MLSADGRARDPIAADRPRAIAGPAYARALVLALLLTSGPWTGAPGAPAGASFVREPFSMEAPAGEFEKRDLDATPPAARITLILGIEQVHEASGWAPSAYFGIRDADDTARFRVFLFQKVPGGTLIAGFDYVDGENLVERTGVLGDLAVGAPVEVDFAWDTDGTVRFSFGDAPARRYDTRIRGAVAFTAVGSAKARFALRPPPD